MGEEGHVPSGPHGMTHALLAGVRSKVGPLAAWILLLLAVLGIRGEPPPPITGDKGQGGDGGPRAAVTNQRRALELPAGITSVIINIGSSIDPLEPSRQDDSEYVIAVEPIPQVVAKIGPNLRRIVICAAISGSPGAYFAPFDIHHPGDGVSSSLAEVRPEHSKLDMWREGPAWLPPQMVVPVMPLSALLDLVPEQVTISKLVTDMQGFDFEAVSSLPCSSLRRIQEVTAETWTMPVDDEPYKGVRNRLWEHWAPHMENCGYDMHWNENMNTNFLGETDVTWYIRYEDYEDPE